jgi:hypothetical protein
MSRIWGSAILAVLLLTAVGFAQTSAGHAILRKAGLFEPVASYTALSFSHAGSLPQKLTSAHARVAVTFNIRNMTGSAQRYKWSLIVLRNGHREKTSTGSASVGSGSTATLTRKLSVACVSGQLRFVVQLDEPAESIDFLTACTPRKGRAG